MYSYSMEVRMFIPAHHTCTMNVVIKNRQIIIISFESIKFA